MAAYKLSYFDLRGISEPIRMSFHYGGVPFEDNQVVKKAWESVKHG